jgi:hypothetical protein
MEMIVTMIFFFVVVGDHRKGTLLNLELERKEMIVV